VNSVTGFTLHEHNYLTAVMDVAANTLTLSGAINIMQRPGFGEVGARRQLRTGAAPQKR
jgi:hypothetical protein